MSSFERMSKAAPSGGYICTLSEEDLASQRGCVPATPLFLVSAHSLTNSRRLAPQCDLGPRQVLWQESRRRQGTHKYNSFPLLSSSRFFSTFLSFMIYRFVVTLCLLLTSDLFAPGISMPVRLFEPRSYLERLTDGWYARHHRSPSLKKPQYAHVEMLPLRVGGPAPRSSTKLRTHRTPLSASNW